MPTDLSDLTHTVDGVKITPGLRVFTNDWVWGTVTAEQFTRPGLLGPGQPYFDGWYKVRLDSGAEKIYNGTRMTTVKPR